jgi:membrane associated rhomboid family serine protease
VFPLHDDNPTRRPAIVNWSIIVVNVLVFLYMLTLPMLDRQLFVVDHGYMPARLGQLADPRPMLLQVPVIQIDPRSGARFVATAEYRLPASRGDILATLLTAMFIHGGWLHIIGNLWFLGVFGNNVEDRLGHLAYLVFYLLGGFLASAGQWAQNPASTTPMVGASGAIAAVLGAYAVTYPHARVHTLVFVGFIFFVDLPALLVLGVWFVGQVIAARRDIVEGAGEGVAFMAHAAGFAAGALLMPLLRMAIPEQPPDEPAERGFDYL